MIFYKIPLTTPKEIGEILDSIPYKCGTSNKEVGRNLLASNYQKNSYIFLKLDDKKDFISWWEKEPEGVSVIDLTPNNQLLGSI